MALNFFCPYAAGLGVKRKILGNRDFQGFCLVGMTGFEPATPRPPDVYSNRAELHPAAKHLFAIAKVRLFR